MYSWDQIYGTNLGRKCYLSGHQHFMSFIFHLKISIFMTCARIGFVFWYIVGKFVTWICIKLSIFAGLPKMTILVAQQKFLEQSNLLRKWNIQNFISKVGLQSENFQRSMQKFSVLGLLGKVLFVCVIIKLWSCVWVERHVYPADWCFSELEL